MWRQTEILLTARPRGFHLVTREILQSLPNLQDYSLGLAHFFLQHTSASLAINENADPSVRVDMENYFNRSIPENAPYFTHTLEGADDMPAHLKAVMIGPELTIPIKKGKLLLGTWQGIYLCEHRNHGGPRRIVATMTGE